MINNMLRKKFLLLALARSLFKNQTMNNRDIVIKKLIFSEIYIPRYGSRNQFESSKLTCTKNNSIFVKSFLNIFGLFVSRY